MKIEKPNEKDTRRESGAAPQGSAGQGGIGLFQAVGYLTGEMKEYRSWLKGRRMSRGEAAGPGQGAYVPPGLDWGSCSLTYPRQVPTFKVLRPQAGSREHNVSYHLNSHDLRIQCISLILALCQCFTPTWNRYRATIVATCKPFSNKLNGHSFPYSTVIFYVPRKYGPHPPQCSRFFPFNIIHLPVSLN